MWQDRNSVGAVAQWSTETLRASLATTFTASPGLLWAETTRGELGA